MPGAASFAAKYPQGGFGYPINSMSGKPWMVNSMAGGGPTLSADSGMGYNAAGSTGNLANVLAGAQYKPAMVGGGGMQMGGGPLASENYGGFQKPSGGKPSIGTAGGGKPNIGYGGGGPTRAARW